MEIRKKSLSLNQISSQLTQWLDSGSVKTGQLVALLTRIGQILGDEVMAADCRENAVSLNRDKVGTSSVVWWLYYTVLPQLEKEVALRKVHLCRSIKRAQALEGQVVDKLAYLQLCVRIGAISSLQLGTLQRQTEKILLTDKEACNTYLQEYILENHL